MEILIQNSSAIPLYEQIENQLRAMILSGTLKQDTPLPSIRHLARELKVSIITIKRAYDDLEKEGFLKTVPGRGTFVSLANLERLREITLSGLEENLDLVIRAAKSIGLSLAELTEILKTLYEEAE